MDLIEHLKKSLEDDHFSKPEKNDLKILLQDESIDPEMLNTLRVKIFELGNQKANANNYPLVMQWIKDTNNVLQNRQASPSEVFFSPGEDCRNAIIRQINGAIRQLKICVFTISDDQITRSILGAHRRRVSVKVITDNDKSFDHGSDIGQLAREGVMVKMDITNNHMHHKFMVVDERSLLTGSYNWTSSAARFNHENILITKEKVVVRSFLKEFESLWKEMTGFKQGNE